MNTASWKTKNRGKGKIFAAPTHPATEQLIRGHKWMQFEFNTEFGNRYFCLS